MTFNANTFLSHSSYVKYSSSDLDTNSYGESRDSSCEKSWVQPSPESMSPSLKIKDS